jgi:hypothetical protein
MNSDTIRGRHASGLFLTFRFSHIRRPAVETLLITARQYANSVCNNSSHERERIVIRGATGSVKDLGSIRHCAASFNEANRLLDP